MEEEKEKPTLFVKFVSKEGQMHMEFKVGDTEIKDEQGDLIKISHFCENLHNKFNNSSSEDGWILLTKNNIDTIDNLNSRSILILVANNGDAKVVQALINANADVNLQAYNGETALMEASKSGYIEVVQVLINANADVNLKDDRGYTALNRILKRRKRTHNVNYSTFLNAKKNKNEENKENKENKENEEIEENKNKTLALKQKTLCKEREIIDILQKATNTKTDSKTISPQNRLQSPSSVPNPISAPTKPQTSNKVNQDSIENLLDQYIKSKELGDSILKYEESLRLHNANQALLNRVSHKRLRDGETKSGLNPDGQAMFKACEKLNQNLYRKFKDQVTNTSSQTPNEIPKNFRIPTKDTLFLGTGTIYSDIVNAGDGKHFILTVQSSPDDKISKGCTITIKASSAMDAINIVRQGINSDTMEIKDLKGKILTGINIPASLRCSDGKGGSEIEDCRIASPVPPRPKSTLMSTQPKSGHKLTRPKPRHMSTQLEPPYMSGIASLLLY
jgi:hypothetical protein